MQRTKLLYRVTLTSFCLNSVVLANVEGDQCQRQMDEILRTEVNCVISFGPTSEAEVVSSTKGVFRNYACSMPVKFPKSDIYGSWIKPDSIVLPTLQLNCDLNATTGEMLKASAKVQPSCKKDQSSWLCDINMSETDGLGVLGRVIENYVNNDTKIKKEFGDSLSKLSKQ